MRYFLTIAASDNSGGAGIQQDIKVAAQLGYWGLSAITGLTVQNFNHLNSIFPVAAEILSEQIEMNLKSFKVSNVKIGAICSEENILAISKVLQHYQLPHVVLDSVFAPTHGKSFIGKTSIQIFKEQLLPYIFIITPNKNELSLLSGINIVNFEQGIEAAINLSKQFGCMIYLKGGHFDGQIIKEALIDKDGTLIFEKERLTLTYSHGTGCVFSSALSCFLGDGLSIKDACREASIFVSKYFYNVL
jgi:hydroxymethylpyrimidine/phosphomethylpyrimidine kinase